MVWRWKKEELTNIIKILRKYYKMPSQDPDQELLQELLNEEITSKSQVTMAFIKSNTVIDVMHISTKTVNIIFY